MKPNHHAETANSLEDIQEFIKTLKEYQDTGKTLRIQSQIQPDGLFILADNKQEDIWDSWALTIPYANI